MATRKARRSTTIDLSKVKIRAGAIGFDKHGRIIIDSKVQAAVGGFKLPPWLGGGPGIPGGGVDAACGDVGCVPEAVCADAACEPESVCADVACEPESICNDVACGDIACEPESICADFACEPEAICTDATCEPESKCVDIFCKDKNVGCEINNGCGGDDVLPSTDLGTI